MKYIFSSDRLLLIFFAMCFMALTGFLFWKNTAVMQPLAEEDWWTLAFTEPTAESDPSFRIQNFSSATEFQYRLLSEGKLVQENALTVPRGGESVIALPAAIDATARLRVEVTHLGRMQSIHR